MTDAVLRRTIRRSVAVLLLPLSLTPWVFVARLKTNGYPSMNFVLDTADEISMFLFLGAILYLVGSVTVQMWDPMTDTEGDTAVTERPESDADS